MTTALDPRRADTRTTQATRVVIGVFGRLATAALVVFHLWLLGTHILTGRLLEPDVLLRWAAAGIVAAALAALHRRHRSLFWGRQAIVLWLLVVLIHGHAAWTGDAGSALPDALPETAAALIPVGVVAGALTLWFVVTRAVRRVSAGLARLRDAVVARAGVYAAGPCLPPFAARPPPVR